MADDRVDPDQLRADPHAVKGRWWEAEKGAFRCRLCPRDCLIRKGRRGFCYVRAAGDDGIYLTTMGRSSGFCIDPIEKKPLFHFYPGTSVLTFGTAGCNLGCRFCQNWDISKARSHDRLAGEARPEQIAAAAQAKGCRSVAFSYNDPVIFAEYALATAAACRRQGIKTVAVTGGYIGAAARPEFFAAMDAVNVDLKGFTETFYREQALGSLQPVLDTLTYVARETEAWLEVTTLLIPGLNDGEEELRAQFAWLVENTGPAVPLHLTAFHPDFKMTDRPATPPATLERARDLALAAGLQYVYTGNVHDKKGGSTWCPGCGGLLIERDWYELGRWQLRDSACAACGHRLPGCFDGQPGDYGARRERIDPVDYV